MDLSSILFPTIPRLLGYGQQTPILIMFEAHMNISFRMKVKVFVLTLAIATYNDSRILSMQSDRFQTNAFSVSVIILGVTPTHIPLKNRWPIGRNDCIHACQPFVCLPLEESNSFVRCHVVVACGWYSNLLWWVNNKLDVLWTCLDWLRGSYIFTVHVYTLLMQGPKICDRCRDAPAARIWVSIINSLACNSGGILFGGSPV